MLFKEDAIFIKKIKYNNGYNRTHYFFLCKNCNIEIHDCASRLKNMSGYCIKCAPNIFHSKSEIKEKTRICSICKKSLLMNKFSVRENGKHRKFQCIKCCNLRKFNIDSNIWDKMFYKQNGKCLICEDDKKTFAVDHCHKTGKVRGLLCTPCNTALGNLKDNIDNLKRAIIYLEKNEQ